MKSLLSFTGAALLLILIVCAAGCTTTTPSTQSTTPAATATAASAGTAATPAAAVTTAAAVSSATTSAASGIDTTVSVHYNDYACLDIQKGFGVTYLFPDEQYTFQVSPPKSGGISPNLLVLDVTDYGKLGAVKPVWDSVQKTWVYAGIVPMVKVIDVNSPQTATLKIKNQGAYYLCIDDRKESASGDTIYLVPVQVTKN